ncbi:unnamed protein product [Rotaria sordida]|uniref:Uncharacterized protein n=1 Tax=Rotaria sordida TaxID=392033 RepID=A0A813XE31_9BILA|nr:unnamed protein product [Rotaria sordida]
MKIYPFFVRVYFSREDLFSRLDTINEHFLNRFVTLARRYLLRGLERDCRLRSSTKSMITRRQTGLIHSLCNALLFYLSTSDHSSNENKHQRPKSASSSSK